MVRQQTADVAGEYRGHFLRLVLLKTCAVLFAVLCFAGCDREARHFVCVRVDRSVSKPSAYSLAVDNGQVGKYAPESKSGAGHFYDDVLEYRVWFHPERGAERLRGTDDYYVAFAQYKKGRGTLTIFEGSGRTSCSREAVRVAERTRTGSLCGGKG